MLSFILHLKRTYPYPSRLLRLLFLSILLPISLLPIGLPLLFPLLRLLRIHLQLLSLRLMFILLLPPSLTSIRILTLIDLWCSLFLVTCVFGQSVFHVEEPLGVEDVVCREESFGEAGGEDESGGEGYEHVFSFCNKSQKGCRKGRNRSEMVPSARREPQWEQDTFLGKEGTYSSVTLSSTNPQAPQHPSNASNTIKLEPTTLTKRQHFKIHLSDSTFPCPCSPSFPLLLPRSLA